MYLSAGAFAGQVKIGDIVRAGGAGFLHTALDRNAAIAAAHALQAHRRRGDDALPELSVAQIEQQLNLAVDRVMTEGGIYDRELAALAIKQASGDLVEAIFLIRAYLDGMAERGFGRVVNITSGAVKAPIDVLGLSNAELADTYAQWNQGELDSYLIEITAEVLSQVAEEMLDWHGSGMSVMEMSHRGREFISIYEAAEADLQSALLQLGKDGGASNPQIMAAQLQLEQAQLNLLYSTVTAPTRGVVTNLQLAIGQFAAAGSPVMTFFDSRGAWITADLRENQIGNIEPGDEVEILFDAMPGQTFRGRVHSIAWGIDPGRT